MEAHPYVTMLHMGDTLLVGYTGHPALFLTRPDGTPFDTVEIPAVRRRGVPRDMVERFAADPPNEEIASMASALVALHRLPSGEVAAFHLDVTVDGRLITADGFLSVLSKELDRACIDIPFRFQRDGRPVVAFRGDTLLVLEQRLVSDQSARSVVRSYRIDTSGCDWIPLGEEGDASGSSPVARASSRPPSGG